MVYYARWEFIHDLMPLLSKTKDAGEDAKVMSVLAPGPLLSIRILITYNDLMLEVRSKKFEYT